MINIKKVRPMANYIVTTREVYTASDFNGIIEKAEGNVKEYQKVIAIGPMVRSVQVGDLVAINPKRYAITKFKKESLQDNIEGMQKVIGYNIPEVEMDHQKYLLITDQDIEFVIEEYEEDKPNGIILPKQEIIKP